MLKMRGKWRLRLHEKGIMTREEIEVFIREDMEGEELEMTKSVS